MKFMRLTHLVIPVKMLIVLAAMAALFAFSLDRRASGQNAGQRQTERKQLDPKAWGGNHAGKPIPDYVHGDECLFCHRNDIGPTWQNNAHGVTVRQLEDAPDLTKMMEAQPALAEV